MHEGIFKPSLTFIESLESELAKSDFAVLTLTPDDQSISRGQLSMEPRDNVLFELGLFSHHMRNLRVALKACRSETPSRPVGLLLFCDASRMIKDAIVP
jgi:predicted nucleotide-binding protein